MLSYVDHDLDRFVAQAIMGDPGVRPALKAGGLASWPFAGQPRKLLPTSRLKLMSPQPMWQ